MSYFLTEEQELIRNIAREFAQNEVEPRAREIDRTDEFPADLHKRCGELGFFGVHLPPEVGGTQAGLTTQCVIIEEVSKACPALGGLLMVQMSWPAGIAVGGSAEQKKRYLAGLACGKEVGALAQTEPSGAMNVGAHQTRLTPEGDHFLLNGLKIFCTHGGATVYMVGARLELDGQDGYTYVLIEKGRPGMEVPKGEKKLGWHGTETGNVLFKDVVIREADFMGGKVYRSLNLAEDTSLGAASFYGNIATAANSLGCAEGIYQKTLKYVKERNLYGIPMTMLQPISYRFGKMYATLEACRALLYDSCQLIDKGIMRPDLAFACKGWICDTAFEITNECMTMWGGHSIMDDTDIHRYMRDARSQMHAEMTSDMHYAFLAQMLLA